WRALRDPAARWRGHLPEARATPLPPRSPAAGSSGPGCSPPTTAQRRARSLGASPAFGGASRSKTRIGKLRSGAFRRYDGARRPSVSSPRSAGSQRRIAAPADRDEKSTFVAELAHPRPQREPAFHAPIVGLRLE